MDVACMGSIARRWGMLGAIVEGWGMLGANIVKS